MFEEIKMPVRRIKIFFSCFLFFFISQCFFSCSKKEPAPICDKLSHITYDFNSQSYNLLETKEFSLDKSLISMLGYKGYYLHFLSGIDYIKVPKWFAITTTAFQAIVKDSKELLPLFYDLNNHFQQWYNASNVAEKKEIETKIYQKAKIIQQKILVINFPSQFVELIKKMYLNLSKEQKETAVAIRSSVNLETFLSNSFKHDSFLNQKGINSILTSIRMVWASLYSDRAISCLLRKGIEQQDLLFAVIIQEMVFAKASGKAFTMDATISYPGIHIIENYGLQGGTDGSIFGDSYLIHAESLDVIKRVLGTKQYYYQPSTKESKIERIQTPEFQNRTYCISPDEAKKIASLIKKLNQDYQNNFSEASIDTEFAIDNKNNDIYFLQLTPIPPMNSIQLAIPKSNVEKLQIIAKGKYSVLGGVHGKIKIIRNIQELEKGLIEICPEDIIVTDNTANYWTLFLTSFKGIITTEGRSPTAHPILIAREKNVPCVIGVSNAIEVFSPYEGQYVTIDGFNKAIYAGKVDLSKVSFRDYSEHYKIIPIEELPDEEKLIQDMIKRGRIIKEQNSYWFISPSSKFSGPLFDIQKDSYSKRISLLQKALGKKDKKIFLPAELKIMDGKIYHKWHENSNQIKIFEDFDLSACETFYNNYEQNLNKVVNLSDNFQLSVNNWDDFCKIFSETCSYMWLSYLFILHVNLNASKQANLRHIPILFYDEYRNNAQESLDEKDRELNRQAFTLAKKLVLSAQKQNINISNISLSKIEEKFPLFYLELCNFAERYKFRIDDDFYADPPVDLAFQKVLDMTSSKYSPIPKQKISPYEEEYFIDYPEIQRWIILSVKARILKNNAHHIRLQVEWSVRKSLLKFADFLMKKDELKNPKDILLFSSDQIRKLIEKYEQEYISSNS